MGQDPIDEKPAPSGLSVFQVPRLKTRAEFLFVRGGEKAGTPCVLIESRRSAVAHGAQRFGVTATKKLGNAVVRNRAKRRLREAATRFLPVYGMPGFDYVLVARSGLIDASWGQLLDDVKAALVRLSAKNRTQEKQVLNDPQQPGQ